MCLIHLKKEPVYRPYSEQRYDMYESEAVLEVVILQSSPTKVLFYEYYDFWHTHLTCFCLIYGVEAYFRHRDSIRNRATLYAVCLIHQKEPALIKVIHSGTGYDPPSLNSNSDFYSSEWSSVSISVPEWITHMLLESRVLVLSVCHRSCFLMLFWDAVNKCCSTSCGGKSLMMTIVNAEQLIEFPLGNLPRESLKAVLKAVTVETSITGMSQSADF